MDGSGVAWQAGACTAPRWRGSRRAATGVHAHGSHQDTPDLASRLLGTMRPPCVSPNDRRSSSPRSSRSGSPVHWQERPRRRSITRVHVIEVEGPIDRPLRGLPGGTARRRGASGRDRGPAARHPGSARPGRGRPGRARRPPGGARARLGGPGAGEGERRRPPADARLVARGRLARFADRARSCRWTSCTRREPAGTDGDDRRLARGARAGGGSRARSTDRSAAQEALDARDRRSSRVHRCRSCCARWTA